MHQVLILNADYTPLRVDSWRRALALVLDDKAALVHHYAGRHLRSATQIFPFPAVVALRRYSQFRTRVRFNRQNLLARDSYRCQYCGVRPVRSTGAPKLEELTLDHVVPRAQAKNNIVVLPWNSRRVPITCWQNIVTACRACNGKKAARTPREAKMHLQKYPREPNQLDLLKMSLALVQIPTEWADFLPEKSEWRDYWTTELQP